MTLLFLGTSVNDSKLAVPPMIPHSTVYIGPGCPQQTDIGLYCNVSTHMTCHNGPFLSYPALLH